MNPQHGRHEFIKQKHQSQQSERLLEVNQVKKNHWSVMSSQLHSSGCFYFLHAPVDKQPHNQSDLLHLYRSSSQLSRTPHKEGSALLLHPQYVNNFSGTPWTGCNVKAGLITKAYEICFVRAGGKRTKAHSLVGLPSKCLVGSAVSCFTLLVLIEDL